MNSAPANGVDTTVKTCSGKVNGVHAEANEPAVTPADASFFFGPNAASEKKDEKKDEEKEIEARKEYEALNAEYKDVPHGSRAELVYVNQRWDKNGDQYYITQKQTVLPRRAPSSDWWQKHALAVIRSDDFGFRTVEVYSEYLRKTLAKVIGSYPSISFDTEHISLNTPAQCLYHYLPELHAEAEVLQEGSVELAHLSILLNFIETEFASTTEELNNLRPQNLISYDKLWTLFRPGKIIHSKVHGYDRAYKLKSCGIEKGKSAGFHHIDEAGFYLTVYYIDYDGKNFGKRTEKLKIPQFDGSTAIATLPYVPLELRARKEEIRTTLIARGRRFHSMRGQCLGEYLGVAIENEKGSGWKYNIESRVMIDGTSYNRFYDGHSWEALEDEQTIEVLSGPEDSLSADVATFKAKLAAKKSALGLPDEDALLATNILRGFSFGEKKWLLFFIDNYSEIVWNESALDRLVLPEASKTLILALVSSHSETQENKFDDIIRGKGRGLVTVLHGSPGVGKTLTAECIAEYTHRPLYAVSSGDLGTSADGLEENLARILDLARTWKAVLLIDEADVFLEKRTLTDVNRNGLVSVFLRLLEYYTGVLFLTTNRINTFDPAFQSRIHMALKYENLDAQARKHLWKDFLSRLNGANVSEEDYDVLAQYEINGRQIKNAVKTGETLASYMRKPLDLECLETVLKTQADCAEAFAGNAKGLRSFHRPYPSTHQAISSKSRLPNIRAWFGRKKTARERAP